MENFGELNERYRKIEKRLSTMKSQADGDIYPLVKSAEDVELIHDALRFMYMFNMACDCKTCRNRGCDINHLPCCECSGGAKDSIFPNLWEPITKNRKETARFIKEDLEVRSGVNNG